MSYAKILSSSLKNFQFKHTLFIVCMDEKVYNELQLNPIPSSIIYAHQELVAFRPELKEVQKERTKAEYFFTCSAQICDFVLRSNSDIDILNYVDADLCFFSSLEPLFEELGSASIGIIPHQFHWTNKSKEKYGKFNVGWISFRNDSEGRKCIKDWAKDCIKWCFQKLENGYYADQKYLNYWPEKYKNIQILKHKGANLAIWNVKRFQLQMKEGQIFVDGQPLIFYHFAGLEQIGQTQFKTHLSNYYVSLKGLLKEKIYKPYLERVLEYQITGMVVFVKEKKNHPNLVYLFLKSLNKIRSILYKDIIEINLK